MFYEHETLTMFAFCFGMMGYFACVMGARKRDHPSMDVFLAVCCTLVFGIGAFLLWGLFTR